MLAIAKGWYVEIVEFGEGLEQLEKRLGPFSSERQAERCESGVMRNLNHERFFARVVELPETP